MYELNDDNFMHKLFIDEVKSAGMTGSGGGNGLVKAFLEGKLTVINDEFVTYVNDCALYNNRSIQYLKLPQAKTVGSRAFYNCAALSYVDLSRVTTVYADAFSYCTALTSVHLPKATEIKSYVFYYSAIKQADLPKVASIDKYTFTSCPLNTLVLRKTDSITLLSNKNALDSTPIANGTGYIYVPAALIDAYKAATNWSLFAGQFRALENYTMDGSIDGELDMTKIGGAA